MKLFTKKDKRTALDKEIDAILEAMKKENPDTEAYTSATKNLEVLYKAKLSEKKDKVSKNTILLVGGNIAVVLLGLYFERFNVITTRALNYVLRGRVD